MCTTCPIGVDALRNKTRTQLVLHLQFLEPLPYTLRRLVNLGIHPPIWDCRPAHHLGWLHQQY